MIDKNLSSQGVPALKSKSIWGGIAALLAGVTMLFTDPVVLAVLPPHILPIVTIIGATLGIYGRVAADKKISGIVSTQD